jgi:hypothetical protein
MKDIRELSKDELREEIKERKIKAFDQAWSMRDWDAKLLSAGGWKHWSDPIMFAGKMNEARMKDWERNHDE